MTTRSADLMSMQRILLPACVIDQASEMKNLKREMADKEPLVGNLGKFNPDDFHVHEDAFLNLLAQSYSLLWEPLHYVVHPDMAPAT
jgi:hypothetical protein